MIIRFFRYARNDKWCHSEEVIDRRRNLFGLLEEIPFQPVFPTARAGETVVEATAALAYPPYLPGRNAGHQGVIFHIFRHDGSGSDQGAAPYHVTAHYRAIRAQRCAFAHARTRINSVHREVRPRSIYIREYAGGAAEDIVLKLYSFVNGDIVLDTDTVADADVIAHIHILSQGTIRSDHSPPLNMAEMPNLRTGAYLDAVIHVAAFVNEKVFLHSPVSPFRFYPIIAGADYPGYDGLKSYSLTMNYFSLIDVIMTQRLSSFML